MNESRAAARGRRTHHLIATLIGIAADEDELGPRTLA